MKLREQIIETICKTKIIAIIRGLEKQDAVQAAQALHAGGIQLIEVALSQKDNGDAAIQAIYSIREQIPDICVGAGTVLTKEQLAEADQAGAQYIISPNVSDAVIRETRNKELVSIPGAFSASEAMSAYEAGADFIKIFPVAAVGPDYVRALKTPLTQLRFIAVGGVNEKNAYMYLQAGAAGVGVSGNLINRQWIEEKRYKKITDLAVEYVRAVNRKVLP